MARDRFRSGDGDMTMVGCTNENNQKCHGTLGVRGMDHLQFAYRLESLKCGFVYGGNGNDMAERKCPERQGSKPGIGHSR